MSARGRSEVMLHPHMVYLPTSPDKTCAFSSYLSQRQASYSADAELVLQHEPEYMFGLVVTLLGISRSYATSSRVSTEMGDPLWVLNQATQANSAWSALRG